jgi:hypothetical protein
MANSDCFVLPPTHHAADAHIVRGVQERHVGGSAPSGERARPELKALLPRFGTQNAEAVLSVVVDDALDEAGQHFLG